MVATIRVRRTVFPSSLWSSLLDWDKGLESKRSRALASSEHTAFTYPVVKKRKRQARRRFLSCEQGR